MKEQILGPFSWLEQLQILEARSQGAVVAPGAVTVIPASAQDCQTACWCNFGEVSMFNLSFGGMCFKDMSRLMGCVALKGSDCVSQL